MCFLFPMFFKEKQFKVATKLDVCSTPSVLAIFPIFVTNTTDEVFHRVQISVLYKSCVTVSTLITLCNIIAESVIFS